MLPQAVQYVLEQLEDVGFAAYAVGGCVRDTLLGRTPGDWDVTPPRGRSRCLHCLTAMPSQPG